MDDEENPTIYIAVVNTEEQYSIWPQDRPVPAGWSATGASGTRAEVLAWIATVSIDPRPNLR